MIAKTEFAGFMVRLAIAIPRYAPNVQEKSFLDVWYQELGHLSPEELRNAYALAVARFDAFPSIRQILELVGRAGESPQDKGREVAERIYHALGRPWSSERRDEYVGPIGVEVVRLAGGWLRLGETVMEKDATTHKAQWREMARIVAEKQGLGAAPGFERLEPQAEIKALAERHAVAPGRP